MYNIGDEVEFWVVADYKDSKWCPRWQKGIVVDIHYYNLCITIRDQYGQVININADQTSPIKKVRKTENNQMKKSDLKNRMVVETRNGNRYMVVDNYLMRKSGYLMLSDYHDDLTMKHDFFHSSRELDIMKIYEPSKKLDMDNVLRESIIWQRDEIKEIKFSMDFDFAISVTDYLNAKKEHGDESAVIKFNLK